MLTDALGDRRVEGDLRDVPQDALIVVAVAGVLLQLTELHLAVVRGLEGPLPGLADTSHRLGVGAEDADQAEIVEDGLRGDGLGAHARVREGDVLGDVVGQVVADHHHVQQLLHRVHRVRQRGVGGRRQHIRHP